MSNKAESFRRNLFAAMQHKQVSQRALSAASGVSLSHLQKIVHGRCVPSIDTADRLADSLGIDLTKLVRNNPVPPA